MGDSCSLYPNLNGQPSKMYQELLPLLGNDIALANYIYCAYLVSDAKSKLTAQGATLNNQGQHSGKAVFDFFNGSSIVEEINGMTNTDFVARNNGFLDDLNNMVVFDTAEEALTKAKAFNEKSKSSVAYAVKNGKGYSVVLKPLDVNTQYNKAQVDVQLNTLNIMQGEMNEKYGIDLKKIASQLGDEFNALNLPSFFNILNTRSKLRDSIQYSDIVSLLTLCQHLPIVQNYISPDRFGSINALASTIFGAVHGDVNMDETIKGQMLSLLNTIKTVSSDISQYGMVASSRTLDSQNKDEKVLQSKDIRDISEQLNMDGITINRVSQTIRSIEDAAADAIITLQRQINSASHKIQTEERKEFIEKAQGLIDALSTGLKQKENFKQLLGFVKEANNFANLIQERLNRVTEELKNATPEAHDMTMVRNHAKLLSQYMDIKNAYEGILKSLANLDNLILNEDVTDTDKNTLKEQAESVLKILQSQEQVANELRRSTMIDLCTEIFGDNPQIAGGIAGIVEMSSWDSCLGDYLHSWGSAQNPIIAAMGQITRDAQDSAQQKVADIQKRIRRATNKLFKAGYTTDFMYDNKGRVISDINWDAYYSAYYSYFYKLKKLKVKGLELKKAMDEWEDDFTEDRVVDKTNGRTQKVPKSSEFKLPEAQEGAPIFNVEQAVEAGVNPMNFLSKEQKEYYDEMMQLYGELQSLLPPESQNVFMPPQLRKTRLQILQAIIKRKIPFKEGIKMLVRENPLVRHEDDTEYGQGIEKSQGDLNNTEANIIPIYYSHHMDSDKLMRNFSMAIQAYADSAIYYDAYTDIQDTLDMVMDYLKQEGSIDRSSGLGRPKNKAEIFQGAGIAVNKMLRKTMGENQDLAIAEGFMEMQLYGKKLDDTAFTRFGQALIGYTSWRALTVNVLGGMNNYLVGEAQMLIEAGAHEFYGVRDYMKANAILYGGAVEAGIMDILTRNLNSKHYLLTELFDPEQENRTKYKSYRYYKNWLAQMIGNFDSGFVYGSGEALIHYTNMYAVLNHEKVLEKVVGPDGKITYNRISLYEAFEKTPSVDKVADLKVKDNVVKLDGTKIDDEYITAIRRRIRFVNQETHGAMNQEDAGLIQKRMIGRLIMNFRRWMVKHYERRYRREHYDESARDVSLTNFYFNTKVKKDGKTVRLYDALEKIDTGNNDGTFFLKVKDGYTTFNGAPLNDATLDNLYKRWESAQGTREGFYVTSWHQIKNVWSVMRTEQMNLFKAIQTNRQNMTEMQRTNCNRTLTELAIIAALVFMSKAIGDEDDWKDNVAARIYIYQVKRLLTDELSAAPTPGIISSFRTIINSPIPAAKTLDQFFYIFTGLFDGDYKETIQRGRYKGKNKYWRNVLKYSVPFYQQIDNTLHIGSEDAMFTPFNRKGNQN